MISRRYVVHLAVAIVCAGSVFGSVAAQQGERFYVVGFIKNPGSYVLKAGMTVGDALETAGGFAPHRTVTGIEIIRIVNGEKQTSSAGFNDAVQANDTIRVK